jgi:hypothetical protein
LWLAPALLGSLELLAGLVEPAIGRHDLLVPLRLQRSERGRGYALDLSRKVLAHTGRDVQRLSHPPSMSPSARLGGDAGGWFPHPLCG